MLNTVRRYFGSEASWKSQNLRIAQVVRPPLLRQGYLQLFAHDHVQVASENTSKEGDPPASLGKLCQRLAVLPVGEVLQSFHHTREPTAGHSTTTTTIKKRISNKFLQPIASLTR